jgi:hypothetical protein
LEDVEMANSGKFHGQSGLFCNYLVFVWHGHFIYSVVVWGIYPIIVGILYQEKSGNPGDDRKYTL